MTEWLRHGDIVLEKITTIDVPLKKMSKVVLAEGTVTGHKHLLTGNIRYAKKNNEQYLCLTKEGILTHEEHNPIIVPAGKYLVRIQREVDLLGEIRSVMD